MTKSSAPLNLNLVRLLLAAAIAAASAAFPLDTAPRCLLVAAAIAMATDVLLNSPWLPCMHFNWLANRRHYLYTGVAAACIGSLIPVSKSAPAISLITLFTLATAACVLAVADVIRKPCDAQD